MEVRVLALVNNHYLISQVDEVASADKEVLVPRHQVVTIVEPIDSLKEMYLEKINGSESNSTDK